MVLPGAPRTPNIWRVGCCSGPNADRFWLPYRSIWLAPMTTWRRPHASVSKTRPNGIQPSIAAAAPMAGVSAMSRASPSVSTMSGEKVSRASLAPIETMVVIGLTMISPASRKSSAQATAHTSARVTAII